MCFGILRRREEGNGFYVADDDYDKRWAASHSGTRENWDSFGPLVHMNFLSYFVLAKLYGEPIFPKHLQKF